MFGPKAMQGKVTLAGRDFNEHAHWSLRVRLESGGKGKYEALSFPINIVLQYIEAKVFFFIP